MVMQFNIESRKISLWLVFASLYFGIFSCSDLYLCISRMLSKPVEPLTGMRPVQTTLVPTTLPSSPQPVSDNSESGQQFTFCPRCSENYEKEFARLAAIEKSFSANQDASKPSLPQWLQKASDQSQVCFLST